MKRDKTNALVPRPGTDITAPARRTSPVIARMTQDILARAHAKELKPARHRIGEYELREPDYRQILRWAEGLEMAPEAVLAILSDIHQIWIDDWTWTHWEPVDFVVEEGSVSSLTWHLGLLGAIPDVWEAGLFIQTCAFYGTWPDVSVPLRLRLPTLEVLRCQGMGLKSIDLQHVPGLTELWCAQNDLGEIDLSPVPQLKELHCGECRLTKLDLLPVPRLTGLSCASYVNGAWDDYDEGLDRCNKLTGLDLSPVPELTWLDCKACGLEELDLSRVPRLRWLRCESNHLTELDLAPVPDLRYLNCGQDDVFDNIERNSVKKLDLSSVPLLEHLNCDCNNITELDLSPVAGLIELDCGRNDLTELDLSPVPGLTGLTCWHNLLNKLDLSPVPRLTHLYCSNNMLTQLDLSPVPGLKTLYCDEGVRIYNASRELKGLNKGPVGGTIVSYAEDGG